MADRHDYKCFCTPGYRGKNCEGKFRFTVTEILSKYFILKLNCLFYNMSKFAHIISQVAYPNHPVNVVVGGCQRINEKLEMDVSQIRCLCPVSRQGFTSSSTV